jgi:hypothetical protein
MKKPCRLCAAKPLSRFAQRSGYRRMHQRSNTIDANYLASIQPILGVCDESGPYRIVTNIIPFLRVTFIAPQNMIEETTLPNRLL